MKKRLVPTILAAILFLAALVILISVIPITTDDFQVQEEDATPGEAAGNAVASVFTTIFGLVGIIALCIGSLVCSLLSLPLSFLGTRSCIPAVSVINKVLLVLEALTASGIIVKLILLALGK